MKAESSKVTVHERCCINFRLRAQDSAPGQFSNLCCEEGRKMGDWEVAAEVAPETLEPSQTVVPPAV